MQKYRPIGHIRTCFPRKNGCPRQGSVCPASQAKLDLEFGSNPHHGIEGMGDFSHVWLLWVFHDNGTFWTPRPHVLPPRLNGVKKGVFATRSPHRPNPIGLTLCRLDSVRGRTLFLSGIDLVDGTPILDIKPYLPTYDFPRGITEDGSRDLASELLAGTDVRYPSWALPSEESSLSVSFTAEAEEQLTALEKRGDMPRVMGGWNGVREALKQVCARGCFILPCYQKCSCRPEVWLCAQANSCAGSRQSVRCVLLLWATRCFERTRVQYTARRTRRWGRKSSPST